VLMSVEEMKRATAPAPSRAHVEPEAAITA